MGAYKHPEEVRAAAVKELRELQQQNVRRAAEVVGEKLGVTGAAINLWAKAADGNPRVVKKTGKKPARRAYPDELRQAVLKSYADNPHLHADQIAAEHGVPVKQLYTWAGQAGISRRPGKQLARPERTTLTKRAPEPIVVSAVRQPMEQLDLDPRAELAMLRAENAALKKRGSSLKNMFHHFIEEFVFV